MKEREKITLERHIQTVLVGIACALIIWAGHTVSKHGEQLVSLNERMIFVQNEIKDIKLTLREIQRHQSTETEKERFIYEGDILVSRPMDAGRSI